MAWGQGQGDGESGRSRRLSSVEKAEELKRRKLAAERIPYVLEPSPLDYAARSCHVATAPHRKQIPHLLRGPSDGAWEWYDG